jgi:hypothetical protein
MIYRDKLDNSADGIWDFYLRSDADMFHKKRLWERFSTKFGDNKLPEMLYEVIGEDPV